MFAAIFILDWRYFRRRGRGDDANLPQVLVRPTKSLDDQAGIPANRLIPTVGRAPPSNPSKASTDAPAFGPAFSAVNPEVQSVGERATSDIGFRRSLIRELVPAIQVPTRSPEAHLRRLYHLIQPQHTSLRPICNSAVQEKLTFDDHGCQ